METQEWLMLFAIISMLLLVGYFLIQVSEEHKTKNAIHQEILDHCIELNFTSTCQDNELQRPYCCAYKPDLKRDGLL